MAQTSLHKCPGTTLSISVVIHQILAVGQACASYGILCITHVVEEFLKTNGTGNQLSSKQLSWQCIFSGGELKFSSVDITEKSSQVYSLLIWKVELKLFSNAVCAKFQIRPPLKSPQGLLMEVITAHAADWPHVLKAHLEGIWKLYGARERSYLIEGTHRGCVTKAMSFIRYFPFIKLSEPCLPVIYHVQTWFIDAAYLPRHFKNMNVINWNVLDTLANQKHPKWRN